MRGPVMCFLCPWMMLLLELFFHCADNGRPRECTEQRDDVKLFHVKVF